MELDTFIFDEQIFYKTSYRGYYVSKSGEIVSVKLKGGTSDRLDYNNPRYHKGKIDKDGYREVLLTERGKRTYRRLHRLIWETFMGKIPNDLTIDHINNNCRDNRLENLQLLTREDNAVKRNKSWVEGKRSHYKVYRDNEFLGIMNRFELEENFGLSYRDLHYSDKGIKTKRIVKVGIELKKV